MKARKSFLIFMSIFVIVVLSSFAYLKYEEYKRLTQENVQITFHSDSIGPNDEIFDMFLYNEHGLFYRSGYFLSFEAAFQKNEHDIDKPYIHIKKGFTVYEHPDPEWRLIYVIIIDQSAPRGYIMSIKEVKREEKEIIVTVESPRPRQDGIETFGIHENNPVTTVLGINTDLKNIVVKDENGEVFKEYKNIF